jgi:hypothetical protein
MNPIPGKLYKIFVPYHYTRDRITGYRNVHPEDFTYDTQRNIFSIPQDSIIMFIRNFEDFYHILCDGQSIYIPFVFTPRFTPVGKYY